MLWNLFILAAVLFVAYAVYANWRKTPAEDSIPKRVWAAIVLAVASASAWLAAFFQQGGIPQ